uniref:Uncharacterized protein n=1 Tax=Panagrolaimus sp. JU765 TaxID=591449 RepID=A0AC34PXU9_9BILA
MIVTDSRFVLFLAILPVLVESFVDLRAIKFAERNGDCFVDVYQPGWDLPEPPTNFFIHQTFKSECYPGHVAHNFNLLKNDKDGYRFTGCFYFKENQTVKCERFEENKFVQNFDHSCNNDSIFKDDKVAVYIRPGKYEVYDNKDVCALDSDKNYVPYFYRQSTGFYQYDALDSHFTHRISFMEYFDFGKVFIHKNEFPEIEILGEPGLTTKWTMDYDYVFDDKQAPGKVELPFSTTFYGIKYVIE